MTPLKKMIVGCDVRSLSRPGVGGGRGLFLRSGLGRAQQGGGERRKCKGKDCAHGRSLAERKRQLEFRRLNAQKI